VTAPSAGVPDESFREHPPEPEAVKPFVAPSATRTELKNHIPVFLVHQPSSLVAVRLIASGGGADVPADRVGAVDVLATSMGRGTSTHTFVQLSESLASMRAAPIQVSWFPDGFTVSVVALSAHARKVVDLVGEVALEPRLDAKTQDYAREQSARASELREDDPTAMATRMLRRVVFGKGVYGENGARPKEIRSARREEVVALHRRLFDARRLSLVVAGDFEDEDVIAAAESAFGKLVPGPAAHPRPAALPSASKARVVVVDKPGAAVATILGGFSAPAASDTDSTYTLALAIQLLADGGFGRLEKLLREEKHEVPWVTYDVHRFRDAGLVAWRTRAPSDHVASVLAQSDAAVRKLVESGPTDDELDLVRTRLGFSMASQFDSAADLAGVFGGALLIGQTVDAVSSAPQRVAQLTRDTVRAVAAKYMDADHMRTVVVGDWAALREPLLALGWGPVEVVDLDGSVVEGAKVAHAAR
jgi:zinc protease